MFWSSALFFEGSSHCFPTTGQNFSLFYKRYKRNRKLMHGNKFIFCSPSCHWLLCFQAILLTTNVGFFTEKSITILCTRVWGSLAQVDALPLPCDCPLLSNLSFWHPPPTTSLLSQRDTFEWVNWHYDICQISILFSQLAVASILYSNWLGWNYQGEFPSWKV